MSRPPSCHNRAYCAVCHESRRPAALPVRDLRRIDPKRTTDYDDEYVDFCDSTCRCQEDDFVFDFVPLEFRVTLLDVVSWREAG